MVVTDTSGLNIKEFELLAGNDAPLGAFVDDWPLSDAERPPLPLALAGVQVRAGPREILQAPRHSAWDSGWNASPKVVEWQLLGSF